MCVWFPAETIYITDDRCRSGFGHVLVKVIVCAITYLGVTWCSFLATANQWHDGGLRVCDVPCWLHELFGLGRVGFRRFNSQPT